MMSDRFNLSKAEKKFLSRFHRNVERIYLNHISVGLSICVAIVGLVLAMLLGRNEGFLIAIIFGGIGTNMFLLSRSYRRFHSIITKMKRHIEELEKSNGH